MGPALCDLALTIGICPQKFTRKLVSMALIALALAVSGCGGDDEDSSTVPAVPETQTEGTQSVPSETETEAGTEPAPPATETTPTESPEDMPGGAGDEEPARTLALFTARAGQIRPRVVRVPAFISIQVELRSADGATYKLTFGDVGLEAGGELQSVSTTIDGLRPGEAIVGKPSGPGNRVRIEATAEPGP
jgi:hypothetical protein